MQEHKPDVLARWEELLAEQAGSGLSVAAFCRERRLAESQFYSWKRRLREAVRRSFVEVQVVEPATRSGVVRAGVAPADDAQGGAIEIRLENGRRVFVAPGFAASHLRAVLDVLESRAALEGQA